MASRLLTRSRTLTRTLLHHPSSSPLDPVASAQSLRCLHSFTSVARSQPSDPRSTVFSSPTISSALSSPKEISKIASRVQSEAIFKPDINSNVKVMCFSPLEATSTNARSSGLAIESKKINITELTQKITFALIPALILISKSTLPTSLLIFSVYWQIYGYLKEIFLDYVHQDVTRTWVLVYLKVLLLILVKDTIIDFGLF